MDPNPDSEARGPKLKKMLSLESGKEMAKTMKKEFKDQVKHLPDGHRGSIASLTERPPYRPIPKEENL